MLPLHIEKALTGVELCFTRVSEALVSGEPLALEAASAVMRQATLDLSALLQRLPPPDLKHPNLKLRLKRLSEGMATQRQSLLRRTVLVERGLNVIIPTARTATQAGTTYANLGKSGGSIKYAVTR